MAEIVPLKIYDFEALGRLIKTWALGVDRVGGDGTYLPKPTNLAGLKQMLVDCGATTANAFDDWLNSFEGSMTTLEFTQSTPQKLVIRLPMAEMVLEKEAEIEAGGQYPLPGFYKDMFFRCEGPQAALHAVEQVSGSTMEQHNSRIGDYTIAQCG